MDKIIEDMKLLTQNVEALEENAEQIKQEIKDINTLNPQTLARKAV